MIEPVIELRHPDERRGASTSAPTATSPSAAVTASVVVDRTVELGVDRASLWHTIATTEGWDQWLVDVTLFDGQITDRSAGIVVDGDSVREVRIDRVADGRMIGFTWWERDDPSAVSHVTLEIVERAGGDGGDGGAILSIREELIGVSAADGAASMGRALEARLAWEVRVGSLWACTVAAALV